MFIKVSSKARSAAAGTPSKPVKHMVRRHGMHQRLAVDVTDSFCYFENFPFFPLLLTSKKLSEECPWQCLHIGGVLALSILGIGLPPPSGTECIQTYWNILRKHQFTKSNSASRASHRTCISSFTSFAAFRRKRIQPVLTGKMFDTEEKHVEVIGL